MKINRPIHYMQPSKTYEKIDWEPYYEGFIGSRLMPDGVCNFIYEIYKDDDGITEPKQVIMPMEQQESQLKVEIVKTYTGQSTRKTK